MKLQKQDIACVPVSIDILPDHDSLYHVYYVIDTGDEEQDAYFPVLLTSVWFRNGEWKTIPQGKITYWLKPIKDVYVLTEDEFKQYGWRCL